MRWPNRGLGLALALLLPAWAACGQDEPAPGWVPTCQRIPVEEAEQIITTGGERLLEGEIEGAVALRAEETWNGRAIWAVMVRVGGARVLLLHDTAPSVESPADPGWLDGRWRAHDPFTGRTLGLPLNSSRADPFPASAVSYVEHCGLSELPF